MNCDAAGYNYIALDGVENCIAALNDIRNGAVHNCFIEMSACAGSCIGGPVMEKYHPSPLKDFTLINAYAGKTDFKVDPLPKETMAKLMPNIREDFNVPTEVEIKEILAKMGKTKPKTNSIAAPAATIRAEKKLLRYTEAKPKYQCACRS